ncbi:MAG: hypothetical protein QM704_22975 [Anaeromyxobacteraceae bacterium]
MSDSAVTFVPVNLGAAEAPERARAVLAWLVESGVVAAEPSACALGGEGHPPGPCASDATGGEPPDALEVNGVELVLGRTVFDAGENGLELACGACDARFEPDEAWYAAVGPWAEGDDGARFACPSCGKAAPLVDWTGPSPWAFGHLGVRFWNWPPLSKAFAEELSRRLGGRVAVVRTHA